MSTDLTGVAVALGATTSSKTVTVFTFPDSSTIVLEDLQKNGAVRRNSAVDGHGRIVHRKVSGTTMKFTKVYEYKHDHKEYRLLSAARFTLGYTDQFLLQENKPDELGDPGWLTVASIEKDEPMLGLIYSLLKARHEDA